MMSEAPRVHLVMRALRWYRSGRMPQTRGSSILGDRAHRCLFHSTGETSHVEIWFDTTLRPQRQSYDTAICQQLTCHHATTLITLIALEGAIEMLQAIHSDGRTPDFEETFAEQPYCPDCCLRKQGHAGSVVETKSSSRDEDALYEPSQDEDVLTKSGQKLSRTA